MTAPRSPRRHQRREPLSGSQRSWLLWGHDGDMKRTLGDHLVRMDSNRTRSLWREHRAELLPEFIAEHPGQRPWAWWRFDAPERSRKRLGGLGTPSHEVLAYAPTFAFGLPVYWVTAWDVDYYNGRAHDVHGQRIGTSHHEGDFKGLAIDPRDPPRYESEAAFLARYRLINAAERARLTDDDFKSEEVTFGDREET
jgi:hypothetical protein